MLRRITSVVLTVSFFILSISGVFMLFSRELTNTLRMKPFHEIFALVMVISGIIHFILNFKTFTAYLKKKRVAYVFTAIIALVAVFYIYLMNTEMPQREPANGNFNNTAGTQYQIPR